VDRGVALSVLHAAGPFNTISHGDEPNCALYYDPNHAVLPYSEAHTGDPLLAVTAGEVCASEHRQVTESIADQVYE
jgi:hypothetical protein